MCNSCCTQAAHPLVSLLLPTSSRTCMSQPPGGATEGRGAEGCRPGTEGHHPTTLPVTMGLFGGLLPLNIEMAFSLHTILVRGSGIFHFVLRTCM